MSAWWKKIVCKCNRGKSGTKGVPVKTAYARYDIKKCIVVKEEIINILKSIKRLSDVDLPKRAMEYLIAEESIQNLKKTLQDIRVKIPRLGSNSENQ